MADPTAKRKSPLSKPVEQVISDAEGWNHPRFDQTEFRREAARFVKCLIRARWKCEPGFISAQELCDWGLKTISNDPVNADRLLDDAASALARLNTDFVPRCGSGGVPTGDETDAEYRCAVNVVSLIQPEGGGPFHNQKLLDAADSLRKGKEIDWEELVRWEDLASIRADLNSMPPPGNISLQTKQNLFRRRGPVWEIRFGGGEANPYPDLTGLYYLYELVKSNGSSLPVSWSLLIANSSSRHDRSSSKTW